MNKKQILFFFLVVVLSFAFSLLTSAATNNLSDRLSGRILLQVESHGEAWYLNPQTKERSFLGRPDDAFNVMRQAGIGITNSDISKISISLDQLSGLDTDGDGLPDDLEIAIATSPTDKDSDNDGYEDFLELLNGYNPMGAGGDELTYDNNFAKNQAGKILLQVEKNGEAWYINPENNKRYFLGRPADAYNLMRELGLGITNNDIETIDENGEQDLDIISKDGINLKNDPTENLLGDFKNQLLSCQLGAETAYSYESETNMFGIIMVSNANNKVKIVDGDVNSCEINLETVNKDFSVKNLDEIIDESIRSVEEDMLANYDKSAEDIDKLMSSSIKDLSVEDREFVIKNDISSDVFNISDNSKTLREAMRQQVVDNMDNMYEDYENMDAMKSVCTGEAEDLLNYLVSVTDESNALSASCSLSTSSGSTCVYENGVECFSPVQIIQ